MSEKNNPVQKSRQKIDLNLIYTLIQKEMKISHINEKGKEENSICALLGLSKSGINYYLSPLKKAGMIERTAFGVWEIKKEYDPELIKRVQKSRQVTNADMEKSLNLMEENDVRGHGFMHHLKIPKDLLNWKDRRKVLEDHGIQFEPLNNLGGGQRIIFEGRKIHLKSNSIIVYETLNYLAKIASDSDNYAIYNYLNLIKRLEKYLGARFTINGKYVFKTSRRHHSLVKNSLAKQINAHGEKLEVSDSGGRWLSVDQSFCNDEFETVHPKTAVNDNEGMQKYFNSHKATNYQVTPEFVLDSINKLVQDRQFYAEHIKTHVGAIQQLGQGINSFNETFDNKMDLFLHTVNDLKIMIEQFINRQ